MDKTKFESSYQLRDMIATKEGLQKAEITTGMNGYPKGLRGCVLLGGSRLTFEQMEELAKKYGVGLVSIRRKDGWQLWECEGPAHDMYDFADILIAKDNIDCFFSWKAYADELRERAYNLKDSNLVFEMAERANLDKLADDVEQRESLGDNWFLWFHTDTPTRFVTENRKVSQYSYDTWNYTLALDCMIV